VDNFTLAVLDPLAELNTEYGVRFAHQLLCNGGRCPPNPLRYFQHGGNALPPFADEEPSNSAHLCGQEKCGAVAPIFLDRVRSVAL
jgi:hypothetical protein